MEDYIKKMDEKHPSNLNSFLTDFKRESTTLNDTIKLRFDQDVGF